MLNVMMAGVLYTGQPILINLSVLKPFFYMVPIIEQQIMMEILHLKFDQNGSKHSHIHKF